ncbi:MAG: tungsten ABC transporter substrate-binding protein [Spirochaetes bacterium RBG_16_49_21]|nr:MAG: tungsten ABC transporter substrate-binding protein [Spirochaetes bacterium RBG_16_49_21]
MYRKIVLMLFVLACAACLYPAAAGQKDIIFATTTSTQDTGLLDELIPVFEKKTGFRVKTIAVGSGQAMAMGERGEADLILAHSPEAEEQFMKRGFGVNRRIVMHNDFVILGPKRDAAKIRGLRSSPAALRKIASSHSLFISRGDNSGTHAKEQKLWKLAGITAEREKWYQQTGQGMGQTLFVANEKLGYTLCDRATYLALKRNIDLTLLVEGDASLMNIYHVIEINPKKFPRVNEAGGRAFADFWVSPETQKMIEEFGIKKYGAILFHPDAVK